MEILRLEDVQKEYTRNKTSVKAVNGINLYVNKGETLGIVGESGCGKSTLGNLIINLIEPSNGKVIYNGTDIASYDKANLKNFRRTAQMIFQDPYSSINPKKKIGWLIKEPLVIHNIGENDAKREEMVSEMLVEVGLDESYKDRYPSQLSGGQRQRVAIAIALITKPDFIVADEPVSALDVSVQAQILNLLKELQEKYNLTYIFISHDLHVVSYLSTRIAVMYLGKVIEIGDADLISTDPKHPYTKALFSASMDVNDTSDNRIVLTGDLPSAQDIPAGCAFNTRCFATCSQECRLNVPIETKLADGRSVSCHLYTSNT